MKLRAWGLWDRGNPDVTAGELASSQLPSERGQCRGLGAFPVGQWPHGAAHGAVVPYSWLIRAIPHGEAAKRNAPVFALPGSPASCCPRARCGWQTSSDFTLPARESSTKRDCSSARKACEAAGGTRHEPWGQGAGEGPSTGQPGELGAHPWSSVSPKGW